MPTIFRHRVEVGDLVFNGPLVEGISFGCDIMDGWYDTAEVKPLLNPRGSADGAYASPDWPSSERYMTLGGWFITNGDPVAADRARDLLVKAFNSEGFKIIRYEAVPKVLEARMYGRVEFGSEMEDGSRWLVTVVAPYPFKYSPDFRHLQTFGFTGGVYYRTYPRVYDNPYPNFQYTRESGDEATPIQYDNTGTAPYFPVIRLIGPLEPGSWVLVNETTGEQLWATVNLGDRQVLTIDTKRMKADHEGYDVSHLIYGDWFGLVPGQNTVRLYASSSSPIADPKNRTATNDVKRPRPVSMTGYGAGRGTLSYLSAEEALRNTINDALASTLAQTITASSSTAEMAPAQPGITYYAHAQGRASIAYPLAAFIQFYDSAGAYIAGSQIVGPSLTVPGTSEFKTLPTVSAIAPAGTAYRRIGVGITGTGTRNLNDTFDARRFYFSTVDGSYFDGDYPDTSRLGYGWDGPAHNSSSWVAPLNIPYAEIPEARSAWK